MVDVVKVGEAMLPPSDPKVGIPCLNQTVADLSSMGLQGPKAVEREELSGRISSILEHREMDHVTLDLPKFQLTTKQVRVKRILALGNGLSESFAHRSVILVKRIVGIRKGTHEARSKDFGKL
ncbi:hypothetical protein V6N12_019490 [Hibiscus sabdariffa]|uniref:Uncharacterized protein n=1 Tax=Hibiscus sabdariffa TaxID=183260 RepID=A0ABR2BMD1_9ROSI